MLDLLDQQGEQELLELLDLLAHQDSLVFLDPLVPKGVLDL